MRSRFETEQDIANEKSIAERLMQKWQCQICKIPDHARFDSVMVEQETRKIIAYIEIKQRKFRWGQYPDVMLSASKFVAGNEYHQAFKVPVLFVVADKIGEIRVCKLHELRIFDLKMGGRTKKKRDAQDEEPVVHIANSDFELVIEGIENADQSQQNKTDDSF